jgi:hypothetical protein
MNYVFPQIAMARFITKLRHTHFRANASSPFVKKPSETRISKIALSQGCPFNANFARQIVVSESCIARRIASDTLFGFVKVDAFALYTLCCYSHCSGAKWYFAPQCSVLKVLRLYSSQSPDFSTLHLSFLASLGSLSTSKTMHSVPLRNRLTRRGLPWQQNL